MSQAAVHIRPYRIESHHSSVEVYSQANACRVESTISRCDLALRISADEKRRLNSYDVEELFMESANARLWRASCKQTGRSVMMKQLPRKPGCHPMRAIGDRLVPLEVYYNFAAYHSDSRICRPLDYFERNTSHVLVMEYVDNSCDLFELVKQSGALSESMVRIVFSQLVMMWESLDRAGICHRDIKDENIIINMKTLECKLIDFGCATEIENDLQSTFSGTPEFYPPEYYKYGSYRHNDLTAWSFGVVLYLLLAGDLPAHSAEDIVAFDIRADPLLRRVSPAAAKLLVHLLESEPTKRASLQDTKELSIPFLFYSS